MFFACRLETNPVFKSLKMKFVTILKPDKLEMRQS